jgi:hypothetical protein
MQSGSGYSKTPLIQKLGYKTGDTVYLFNVPEIFETYLKENGIIVTSRLPAQWAHCFFNHASELEIFINNTNLNQIEKALWVSWPKKTSKVISDLTEQSFRDKILKLGWVDIKVAAIDETWSGLKFTRRKKI